MRDALRFVPAWLLAALIFAAAGAGARGADNRPAFEQNTRLGRGVNILGYDPIWRDAKQARFKAEYFRRLKQAGFSSVRINLQPFRFMKAEDGWKLPDSWYAVADWAVNQALANQLMPVLDLHEFTTMGKDAVATKPPFLAFWRQVSAHYQHASDAVVFEILNEPSKQLTPELWNEYLAEALAIIRERNPTRTVIIGPAYWNSIDHLRELRLPAQDRDLIVTVHYYQPMRFTHQGARWTDYKDARDITWSGTGPERQKLAGDFAKVAAWAQEQNRPIYVGEFGAYDKAPMESRARYVAAVARAAEEHGWSWAYWQFDSDFVLYDVAKETWVQPLLDALIPPTATGQSAGTQGR